MSVTIQLDLPDALVKEARDNGLLEADRIGDMLTIELRRRKAASELNRVLEKICAQPGEPMSEDEIQAEVKAARRERRAREAERSERHLTPSPLPVRGGEGVVTNPCPSVCICG